MKQCSELTLKLNQTVKTDTKLEILKSYFAAKAGIPIWLFEACQSVAGNFSETIKLLITKPDSVIDENITEWMSYLKALETSLFTMNSVLIAAQISHGRSLNFFTDYTFAVWHGKNLIPVTKAYSGLSDSEIHEIDAFVKNHTLEKSGPVRRVMPALVFEIAFEGIQSSKRQKSGIALRFPRILRWRRDKEASEATTLDCLLGLLENDDKTTASSTSPDKNVNPF